MYLESKFKNVFAAMCDAATMIDVFDAQSWIVRCHSQIESQNIAIMGLATLSTSTPTEIIRDCWGEAERNNECYH